jgi:hypothetical protein
MTRTIIEIAARALVALAACGCKKPAPTNTKALDADAPVRCRWSGARGEDAAARDAVRHAGRLRGSAGRRRRGRQGDRDLRRARLGRAKGAVLARLDSRAASAQAAQAAADAEASKIQAQQSKLDCERTEHMFQKGAISKADYDQAHTQCEAASGRCRRRRRARR